MQVEGACHCGAVSFTADVDVSRVIICHCTDCQILSGTAFRAVVAAPYESLSVKGQTKSYVKVAQSGNRRAQVFCPECGTPLWAAAVENPSAVNIRMGCIGQRAQFQPAAQIWQHSALPWVSQLGSVPGSPEQQLYLSAVPPQSAA